MKQTDTLEIEMGLKSLLGNCEDDGSLRNFENRSFVLKFLNKLDPSLGCKGRIILTGADIIRLQHG
jgi:hypothetical protein